MCSIRPAKTQDIVSARRICVETADSFLRKTERRRRITSLLFCDYYLLESTAHCFVLDDKGEVIGYILCARDVKAFWKHYRTDIFRQVFSLSPLWGMVCLVLPLKYVPFFKKYPAHLHIDILPPYQSSGYGSRLMTALLEHLQAENVPGVCLSCSAENRKAVNFYKKFGFEAKLHLFGSLMMVKSLK